MSDLTGLDPHVEALRQALTQHDIYWAPVRDYAKATYLPYDGHYTVWWDRNEFLWGHSFEFHDKTVDDVITRLKELSS